MITKLPPSWTAAIPGAALPSEPELVSRYDVSRPTVRKAIETLVSEGLAYVMRSRGSFVRPIPQRPGHRDQQPEPPRSGITRLPP